MIISTQVAKKSRKIHKCDNCGKRIDVGEPNLSMFGFAEPGDKPYMSYTHIKCASGNDNKILAILAKAGY